MSGRVQTVEGGVPVAKTTVQRELGHQSELMLDRVYARIGDPRYRARRQVVEYRLPDGRLAGERLFRARLGEQVTERLAARVGRWTPPRRPSVWGRTRRRRGEPDACRFGP